jgi:hypothetical protein
MLVSRHYHLTGPLSSLTASANRTPRPAYPTETAETPGGRTHELVRSDENMERAVLVKRQVLLAPDPSQRLPILRMTPVRDSLETGHEAGQLLLPIVQRRRRRDDEERAPEIVMFGQISQEGDGLDCLSLSAVVFPRDNGKLTLPSPISSARIPLMPCSYRLPSHVRPLS